MKVHAFSSCALHFVCLSCGICPQQGGHIALECVYFCWRTPGPLHEPQLIERMRASTEPTVFVQTTRMRQRGSDGSAGGGRGNWCCPVRYILSSTFATLPGGNAAARDLLSHRSRCMPAAAPIANRSPMCSDRRRRRRRPNRRCSSRCRQRENLRLACRPPCTDPPLGISRWTNSPGRLQLH